LLTATIVQVNLCSPCPSIAHPMCPLFFLANDRKPKTHSIRVRGRLVLEIKPEQTSCPVYLVTRLFVVHTSAEVNFALPINFWVVLPFSWHPNILNSFLTFPNLFITIFILLLLLFHSWISL
jgi:hypothetical protein